LWFILPTLVTDLQTKVRDATSALEKEFGKDHEELQKTVRDTIRNLAPDVLPDLKEKIAFLDREEIEPPFVVHLGAGHDLRIDALKEDGMEEDCATKGFPSGAHGAIVRVMIASQKNGDGAIFQTTDSKGKSTDNGITNYNQNWVGGIFFCPFYKEQRFKWRLVDPGNHPIKDVQCIGKIIGSY
jgi:hypothetical protein